MSDNLANKIAAGEVVERISSVVKELVENSIDAKAKNIIVDLIDSGLKEIKVTDDGIGMDSVDAQNAFLRHATSKLLKEDDLFFINTLGFRGEALPSIASVSKVDLNTSNGSVATHLTVDGGVMSEPTISALNQGTVFKVNDLFYNTPARLKYLKSDATELSNVTNYIEKLALSQINISFTLTNNGKRIIYTSGSGNLLKCIHEIYGYTVSSNMIEIKCSNDDYDVFGYIAKPVVLKSNRNDMTVIVNGRYIKNVDINRAINDGYHTFKPDIKYPVVVLKIETDPTLIDVNIHPSKQDIKFSKLDDLMNMITSNISSLLRKSILIPEIENVNSSYEVSDITFTDTVNEDETVYTKVEQDKIDFKMDEAIKKVNEETKQNEIIKENELIKKLELYPQGIVFGTYIIAQNDEGMFIIDQHAAQERINYEKVLKALRSEAITTIEELIPISIEYSASDFIKLKNNMEFINSLGFKLEEFGVNTYAVKEHPTWLRQGYEEESIRRIFEIIIEGKYTFDRLKFNDHVAATMACKMSVKGNEAISLTAAEQLLNDLVLCDNPYNCPHGRPTIIKFTKYELERMFKRVMN